MPCSFGNGFTLPNVFLRPYFAYPEHRPSGQQGDELEPKRESGWVAKEVLMFKNWDWDHSSSSSPSWSILVYLCPATEQGALPDLNLAKSHGDLKSSYLIPSTQCFLPTSLNTLKVTSIPQGGSQLTQCFTATSKSNHIWSTRHTIYRCYHKRHFKL